jgi:hypothetical protein
MNAMRNSFDLCGAICALLATAFFCQAQTRTVVLSPPLPLGSSTNVVINVASNEVFELLYVNWPGEQAGGQLCPPYVLVSIGGINVKDDSYTDLLERQQQRSTIAGPATIRLVTNGECVQGTYVFTYRITREVDNFVPNTGVVIPADAAGPVSVKLESSTDLTTWNEAQPGTYGTSSTARYFRLRAVRN